LRFPDLTLYLPTSYMVSDEIVLDCTDCSVSQRHNHQKWS